MKIIDVIKYEGDNSTFVWKHPGEDFNIFSQLIVHENQEAIFMKDGKALDMFGPGRYTLKTQNIPLLSEALNLVTGGATPFHCEVYFINKTEDMAIRWGTDTRVQYIEPTYGFPLSIGASGEMSLLAADSRKLLLKLVGTGIELSQDGFVRYFRAFLMNRVKSMLASIMKSDEISIFEIDGKLASISDSIKNSLSKDFAEYGIDLRQFLITTVSKPDGDEQYEKFKELHFRQYADIKEAQIKQQTEVIEAETEARKTVIGSKAMATKRAQEGYTYSQERGFDVAEKVADNEAVGEFTNMGVGFGTMAGVGGAVGGVVGGLMTDAMGSTMKPATTSQNQPLAFCDNCGAQLMLGASFCGNCGVTVGKQKKSACSNCGYVFERPGKFCPKCGAKREV